MSELTVKFLGSDYTFPYELKEYVSICSEFEKINDTLSKALLTTMKRPSIIGDEPSQAGDVEQGLKEKMRNEGKKIIPMLAKHNIFDVTESDLIENNKGYIKYEETYKAVSDTHMAIDKEETFLDNLDKLRTLADEYFAERRRLANLTLEDLDLPPIEQEDSNV
jgi:hypothetical protein